MIDNPTIPQGVISTGVVRAAPLSVVIEEERRAAEAINNQPIATGIAQHIRKCWQDARYAKQMTVEPRLLQNMRARRGEYDPDKLALIREQGGSEVFAGITSVKCRAATSWLRDVMMATGTERPWTLKPTPVASLEPDLAERVVQAVAAPLAQLTKAGMSLSDADLQEAISDAHDAALLAVQEEARKRADRMANKMEDQLLEGGFLQALDAFLDDITTFPCAIIKGPVIRKRNTLQWAKVGGKWQVQVQQVLREEWERVAPFNIYPAPSATTVADGYLIEKHRMSRDDLNLLIGVEGYSDASIRTVIDQYGRGGLREWLTNDVAMASAEGKATTQLAQNVDGLIDALQFWGNVSGRMLLDWGLTDEDIPDPTKEYHIEAWLIGQWVIKAVLNYDPLFRKPYYKASYEDVPGNWWGNSVADLVRDAQTVANAAARGIVNNMAIASGPQTVVNVERLAAGEEVTQLKPWRIWQVTSDITGANQPPVDFFQPDSRIGELMTVFSAFSQLADEYSGLPKYISGETGGSAGRTASGLSMLMGNAGKAIKQVVSNIDIGIMTPLLERLYDHNMQYSDDDELKGDVQIIARGADSLIAKEQAAMARTQFLAATANPLDAQIIGVQGRAAVLREVAKGLDMDVDQVVPSVSQMKEKMMMAQLQQQASAEGPIQAQGSLAGPPSGGGDTLMTGQPATDLFSPQAQ
jgi:hypothetical protein